jgi:hypothetical protein
VNDNKEEIRRVYYVSGCDRIFSLFDFEWNVLDYLGEETGKTTQEVLQCLASQFPDDVFERHKFNSTNEIMRRAIQWGDGMLGEPVNAVPDPRIAPRP